MPNNVIEGNQSQQQQQQQKQNQPTTINPNNPFANNGNMNGSGNLAGRVDRMQLPMQVQQQQQQSVNMPNMNLPPPGQQVQSGFTNNSNTDLANFQVSLDDFY